MVTAHSLNMRYMATADHLALGLSISLLVHLLSPSCQYSATPVTPNSTQLDPAFFASGDSELEEESFAGNGIKSDGLAMNENAARRMEAEQALADASAKDRVAGVERMVDEVLGGKEKTA